MPLVMTAEWTHNCIPQPPVSVTQRPNETVAEAEERFEDAVAAGIQQYGEPDPPGTCE